MGQPSSIQPAAKVGNILQPAAVLKRKATLNRMEKEHAISRGISVTELRRAKNERKGLDKRKGLWYTVSTIKQNINERIKKMANKNNNSAAAAAQAVKPAKKNKSWVTWQQVLGTLVLAPFAFVGAMSMSNQGYSKYALAGVVVAFGAYLILEKRSK